MISILDIDLVEHHGRRFCHQVWAHECQKRIVADFLIGERIAERGFGGASPWSYDQINVRDFEPSPTSASPTSTRSIFKSLIGSSSEQGYYLAEISIPRTALFQRVDLDI